MSFVADRRLTLFLRQKGVHCGGKLHVPFKAFLQTTSAILQDTNHINGATASKMIRKALGLDEDATEEIIFETVVGPWQSFEDHEDMFGSYSIQCHCVLFSFLIWQYSLNDPKLPKT